MDGIAPLSLFLIEVIHRVEQGSSLRDGLSFYVEEYPGRLQKKVTKWLINIEVGTNFPSKFTQYEAFVFEVLARGLEGYPILADLYALEEEVLERCAVDIRDHLERLPLKLMLPLLFVVFPSFLILVFGPLLNSLITEVRG